jgi:ABC-type protease/lipase transport system fused ATPase/permease subunit
VVAVADGAIQRFDLLLVGQNGGMNRFGSRDDVLSVHGRVLV